MQPAQRENQITENFSSVVLLTSSFCCCGSKTYWYKHGARGLRGSRGGLLLSDEFLLPALKLGCAGSHWLLGSSLALPPLSLQQFLH